MEKMDGLISKRTTELLEHTLKNDAHFLCAPGWGNVDTHYQHVANLPIYCLHPSCTKNDAAVYQIAAQNCFGMICCSASIEVECSSENPQLPPNQKDDGDAGWKHKTETRDAESTKETDESKHLYKEEESVSPGTPTSAGSFPPKLNHSGSLQLLTSDGSHSVSSEKPLDAKRTRQTQDAYDPNDTEETAEELLFPNSSNIPEKQDVCYHKAMHSEVSWPVDGALHNNDPNDKVLNSSHENPQVQKYVSCSQPLSEAAASIYPGSSAPVNRQLYPQVSSEDSDSDYELCPEITLIYAEEFSDDDLEYLECSDVMTNYSNAVWQKYLQGTDGVFLLESDDEVTEFSECCLGGCGHFLSEMGCQSQVSDNTGPMDATPVFCGHHSQPQELEVRTRKASMHSPSFLQPGMTLTLGPHQAETSTVTDRGRYKLPPSSGAAENVYTGVPGETRDNHQARDEVTGDNLLTMDKTQTEMKPDELEKLGAHQCLGTAARKRVWEKDLLSTRGSQKPTRMRQPGTKGKPRKLNTPQKGSATEGTVFNRLYSREPAEHRLAQNDKRVSSHTRAEATDFCLQFHAEECAISPQAEQEAKIFLTSTNLLPREDGDANFKREGTQFNNLFEASQVPDQREPPQVQIQKRVGEKVSLSQKLASVETAWEESPPTGTTTSSLSNFGGFQEENVSLTQCLEVESCTQSPQHEEQDQDRADNIPCGPWKDLEHVLSIPEASSEYISSCKGTGRVSWGVHSDLNEPKTPSVPFPDLENTTLTLENTCEGPSGRETTHSMKGFEAGAQGPCHDTTDSSVGAPVDRHLPQEICSMNLELVDGQSKASDLYSTDDKMLEVFCNVQSSEPPQSTYENGKDRDLAMSPLFVSTFTWSISKEAHEGATADHIPEAENSSSTLACVRRANEGSLSPSNSGGLQNNSSENNSLQFREGGKEEVIYTCTKDTTETPVSHSSVVTFPQKKPTTLTPKTEDFQATRESENTSAITIATEVQLAKYLAASAAENNHADATEESSPQARDENRFQCSSSHILNGSTADFLKELSCMVPSVPHLPAGEGFCSDSLLELGNQFGDKSHMVDRVAHRSPVEKFQIKGSETKQRPHPESLPHQGLLCENDFQEHLSTTSAVQKEVNSVHLDHLPGNSREERGKNSGLGTVVSVVDKATVKKDCQALSKVLPASQDLMEKPKDSGLGSEEPGKKLKIITLESSISEIWPPRQLTGSEYKEPEAIPKIPERVWATSEVLKVCELGSETVAPASSSQCECGSTIASSREIHGYQGPASSDKGRSLSSQYVSQFQPLGSSVDPVDEKDSCTTNFLSEAAKTGERKTIHTVSQNQQENQLKVDHPAFFKQLLTCSQILESSVDPIDEIGRTGWDRTGQPELSTFTPGLVKEKNQMSAGNMGQKLEVYPGVWHFSCAKESRETFPDEENINHNQEGSERREAEQSQHHEAKVEGHATILQVPHSKDSGEVTPSDGSVPQVQEGSEGGSGDAAQSKPDKAQVTSPPVPLSDCLAVMTHVSVGADTNATGLVHDVTKSDIAEPRNHQNVSSDSKETRKPTEDACAEHLPSPSGLTLLPFTPSPGGGSTNFSISSQSKESKREEPWIREPQPPNSPGSLVMTSAFLSGQHLPEDVPRFLQAPCPKGSMLDSLKKSREEEMPSHMVSKFDNFPGTWPVATGSQEAKKQETAGSGRIAEGVKKKILSRVAALRLRLEEENVRKTSTFHRKTPKPELSVSYADEKKDQKEPPCKREGKAPVLLKKIQAEMIPHHSGNVKLSCQFAEIHEDSTIWWTKDSKPIAQVQRSAGDHSTVSLAIVQAGQKDQGFYYCSISNSYGKVTAEFNLTAEVLKQLSSHQDIKGCEEIEFSQLIFEEDFLSGSYFGGNLRGQIATEELHFGEGVHRKAFRSTVMRGLAPVFQPGHACVLKVHSAIAYGTRNNDELIQRNYRLAAQECYVQNTARRYAKIYAAEAQPLEGFGEVPEIIPIFLIHRPENNIPYATVEEELIGEFVKYSIRDGKEINFLRRESEAGQKCCTFQHWVYQKTSGCLLVTDMQGVGMKLTDVGIATLGKGYKGFKGNCSMTFIDQFKALHQCNKYCKMLGLKSLQNNNQKQKKPSVAGKSKVQPKATTVKKVAPRTLAEKKT